MQIEDDRIDRARVLRRLLLELVGRTTSPVYVGRYELREWLGQGASGTVWSAFDPLMQRTVAIKQLGHATGRVAEVARAEARTLARLSHPNVVEVFEALLFEDRLFIVMEHLRGQRLDQWSQTERTEDELTNIMLQVAEGLSAARKLGLVHGDVKPSNVFVTEPGRVKLLDFGLSRPLGDELERGGTPKYRPPLEFGQRSRGCDLDQYAFGIVGLELLEMTTSKRGRLRRSALRRLFARCASLSRQFATFDDVTDQLRRIIRWPFARTMVRSSIVGVLGLTGLAVMSASLAVPPSPTSLTGCDRRAQAWRDRREGDSQKLAEQLSRIDPRLAREHGPSILAELSQRRVRFADAYAEACQQLGSRRKAAGIRLRCLMNGNDELSRAVDELFEHPPHTATEILRILHALPDSDECELATPGDSTGTLAARQWESEAIMLLLEHAERTADAGHPRAALAMAEHALERAKFGGDALSRIRARGRVGARHRDLGNFQLARDELERAFIEAEAANEPLQQLRLAYLLLATELDGFRNLTQAKRWGARMRALLDRSSGHPLAEMELENGLAHLAFLQGDLEGARIHLRRAREWIRLDGREGSLDELAVVFNLASVSARMGDLNDAIAQTTRLLALEERHRGSKHPQLVGTLKNLAYFELDAGRTNEARNHLERARVVCLQALGREHADCISLLLSEVDLDLRVRNLDAAEGRLETLQGHRGDPRVPIVLRLGADLRRGRLLRALGRRRSARDVLRSALDLAWEHGVQTSVTTELEEELEAVSLEPSG